MGMLRWILGVSRLEKLRNEEVRRTCGVADIVEKMREARLRWISFFLVGYVEEKLWWSIQSPNIGRKKKASS